jgi:hypothetical protein
MGPARTRARAAPRLAIMALIARLGSCGWLVRWGVGGPAVASQTATSRSTIRYSLTSLSARSERLTLDCGPTAASSTAAIPISHPEPHARPFQLV